MRDRKINLRNFGDLLGREHKRKWGWWSSSAMETIPSTAEGWRESSTTAERTMITKGRWRSRRNIHQHQFTFGFYCFVISNGLASISNLLSVKVRKVQISCHVNALIWMCSGVNHSVRIRFERKLVGMLKWIIWCARLLKQQVAQLSKQKNILSLIKSCLWKCFFTPK